MRRTQSEDPGLDSFSIRYWREGFKRDWDVFDSQEELDAFILEKIREINKRMCDELAQPTPDTNKISEWLENMGEFLYLRVESQ